MHAGGNPIIYPHVHKFCGIRNGIDSDLWDPENNRFLPAPIKSEEVAQVRALRARPPLHWRDRSTAAVAQTPLPL